VRCNDLLQRASVLFQELAGERQEARAGVASVGEYESRASR
jgi:hypothetical protein